MITYVDGVVHDSYTKSNHMILLVFYLSLEKSLILQI